MPCGNQYIDLSCQTVGRFVHIEAFNAGGYFRTDRQALVCGDFFVPLSSSMPNLFWTSGWSGYRRGFRILACLWDALIISILKYVLKLLLVGRVID